MNTELVMCEPTFYRIDYEINPYMDVTAQPEAAAASREHRAIVAAHEAAGRRVWHVPAAPECPDMVYTANTALVRGRRAVLGEPPPLRKAEIAYMRDWLLGRGISVLQAPFPFSGQGDALACGDLLLFGHGQRTDRRMHVSLADYLGYEVVPLRTVSSLWYDLDLAVAVLSPNAVAYYPDALDSRSCRRLRGLGLELVEVCASEAARFALNLISDATTVTMTTGAPRLASDLRALGLRVVELDTTQLRLGGGGVRCTALTLDNPSVRGPR
jgi:N-dimethylarginine dimethylaminohydrolase